MTIIIDSTSSSGDQVNVVTYNWNHTCAAGVNLLVVAPRAKDPTIGDRDISGITYDGDAFSQAIQLDDPTRNVELWYLANPNIGGALSIIVTQGGSTVDASAGAISLKGVDLSDIVDITDSGTGISTTHTLDFSGRAIGAFGVGSGILSDGNPANLAVTTGTEIDEVDQGDNIASSAYNADGDIVWTSPSDTMVICGATFNAKKSVTGFSGTMIKNWIFMRDAWEKHDKIWTPKLALPNTI